MKNNNHRMIATTITHNPMLRMVFLDIILTNLA